MAHYVMDTEPTRYAIAPHITDLGPELAMCSGSYRWIETCTDLECTGCGRPSGR